MPNRIMIIDDEPAIGKLLVHQLTMLGHQARYYNDGLTALECFESEHPDLVLLDVMMPTINGWDVCRQLRSFSQVPIMMLTAKSAELDVITGLSAGADDYLSKPFTMPELEARITAVMRRRTDQMTPPHGRDISGRGAPIRRERAPVGNDAQLQPATHTEGQPVNEQSVISTTSPRLGAQLRAARLARGTTLSEAAAACRVRWEYLQAIEQENFSYVPRPQLRVALPAYSAYLGVALPGRASGAGAPAPKVDKRYRIILVLLAVLVMLSIAALAVAIMTFG